MLRVIALFASGCLAIPDPAADRAGVHVSLDGSELAGSASAAGHSLGVATPAYQLAFDRTNQLPRSLHFTASNIEALAQRPDATGMAIQLGDVTVHGATGAATTQVLSTGPAMAHTVSSWSQDACGETFTGETDLFYFPDGTIRRNDSVTAPADCQAARHSAASLLALDPALMSMSQTASTGPTLSTATSTSAQSWYCAYSPTGGRVFANVGGSRPQFGGAENSAEFYAAMDASDAAALVIELIWYSNDMVRGGGYAAQANYALATSSDCTDGPDLIMRIGMPPKIQGQTLAGDLMYHPVDQTLHMLQTDGPLEHGFALDLRVTGAAAIYVKLNGKPLADGTDYFVESAAAEPMAMPDQFIVWINVPFEPTDILEIGAA